MNHKSCVLIVDDDFSQRLLLRKLLSKSLSLNPAFIEASDGKEAVLFTQQHQPDLILMNLRMPGMDGYEAVQQIRASESMRQADLSTSKIRIPIIAISADVYPSAQSRAFEVGCDEFIGKPYMLQQVQAIVKRYLMLVDCYAQMSSHMPYHATA